MTAGIKVAVDASRIKSGGGIAHLKAIMNGDALARHGVAEVHIWSYRELLDKLPDKPWLVKHCPAVSTQSLLHQIYWQATRLAKEIKAVGCDVLFSVDATTFCNFKPLVLLHQNMIPFEIGFEKLYGLNSVGIHQRILRRVQIHAFKRAQGVVFLTHYAAKRMQLYTGELQNFICIAHGVDEVFKQMLTRASWPQRREERPITCLYVSPAWKYKHQAEVVRAIKILRDRGYELNLILTGGGNAEGQAIVNRQIAITDPNRCFIKQLAFVTHEEMPALMANADIFVFASSVETFGITLLEAMAMGMPIACSNRSSLPETLKDAGVYFDPQDEVSIADATERLINDAELRQALASKAQILARNYSWEQCATQTWQYIAAQVKAA